MQRALVAFLSFARVLFAAAPVVTNVEPPDWPVEPNGITLRMLMTATDLAGAGIRCKFYDGALSVSSSGTHLFFDLTIPQSGASRKISANGHYAPRRKWMRRLPWFRPCPPPAAFRASPRTT